MNEDEKETVSAVNVDHDEPHGAHGNSHIEAPDLVQVGGGESSEGEGDVEVEHIIGEDSGEVVESIAHNPHQANITFDVRKRTLITIWQRTVLEEFYKCGMTSASLQLNHLHVAAAERTGLDVTVVKNWIRNRRRPTAAKSAERLAERMAHSNVLPPVPSIAIPTIPSLTGPVTNPVPSLHNNEVTVTPPHGHHHPHTHHTHTHSVPSVGAGSNPHHTHQHTTTVVSPEPKRVCLEPSATIPQTAQHHSNHSHLVQTHTHTHPVVVSISQNGPVTNNTAALTVKARISDSGESDFIEVEVPSLTYSALLKACCEEMDLSSTDVAKIRKLPNIWVRKDRDVQRMKEGQELEVVLKSDNTTVTSILTVNPFSSAGNLPLLNLHQTSGASGMRTDTENSIIAALTEVHVPTSMSRMSELQGDGSSSAHNSHQVNGLH